MYSIDLAGKKAIIFGVANQRSIAWAIAQILHEAGARIAIAYQGERVRDGVAKLTAFWDDTPLIECDVSSDDNVEAAFKQIADEFGSLDIIVHSIAFANRDDLDGARRCLFDAQRVACPFRVARKVNQVAVHR